MKGNYKKETFVWGLSVLKVELSHHCAITLSISGTRNSFDSAPVAMHSLSSFRHSIASRSSEAIDVFIHNINWRGPFRWKSLQMFCNCSSRPYWDHYSCFVCFAVVVFFLLSVWFFRSLVTNRERRGVADSDERLSGTFTKETQRCHCSETCKLDSRLSMIYNWSIKWGKLMFSVIQASSASY